MGENRGVPAQRSPQPRAVGPDRLRGAVFQTIGDESRAAMVERRIAEAITGGLLRPDERLPSESELAKSFGVAHVTAREALQALRLRGLVVTSRGRHGGSFVAPHADAGEFTRQALRSTTRLALRDLGIHYLAVTAGCLRLAVTRADPSEIAPIRRRTEGAVIDDPVVWRRVANDAMLELCALSQSARLTREQMKLQAELSPYLALLDDDAGFRARHRADFWVVLDAVDAQDAAAGIARLDALVGHVVDGLIELQAAEL